MDNIEIIAITEFFISLKNNFKISTKMQEFYEEYINKTSSKENLYTNIIKKNYPICVYEIYNYLYNNSLKLCNDNIDGRINSIIDEDIIIENLKKQFPNKIKKSKK